MLRFLIKNRLYIVIWSILVAWLFTVRVALPALAVALVGPLPGNNQQNNQLYHGNSNFGNDILSVGRNQGNTGNSGVNRGFNLDNVGNAGNQVTQQRKTIKTQINNQHLRQGNGSGSGNSSVTIGAFQGNSGNSGINLGNNQDNAGNSGNEVNNQGNVIGTQINKQGTSVNNSNNVIEHQINYVNLIPDVGVYFSLRPRLDFGLSIGN